MSIDFENGIKFSSLERDIKGIHLEITNGSGKENSQQKENLRQVLDEKFQEYMQLGLKYKLSTEKLSQMEKLYYESNSIEWPPKMKKPEFVAI